MVTRRKLKVKNVLHSEGLYLYPPENQAAKIFAKWLSDHPEYSADDVDMCVDSYEREEGHYGNGGGFDRFVKIYKWREETDDEYAARIADEEAKCLDNFKCEARSLIKKLIDEFSIYPYMEGSAITAHLNDIEDSVMAVVSEKIHQAKK